MNKFPHTRKALREYDASEYKRKRMVDRIETEADVREWQAVCDAAVLEVQKAFYEDTKPINSMNHCKYATISWLRELTTKRR